MKQLFTNPSYILLLVSYNFLYGIYTTMGAVVSNLTSPYGYSTSETALFGASFILAGVFASFGFSVVLDRTNRYKLCLNILTFGACFSVLGVIWSLPSKNELLLELNLILAGIFVLPMIPVAYGFAVEITYPMPESVSNGMMIMISQLFGTLLGLVATILAKMNPIYCVYLFLGCTVIAAINSLFVKEDLRRVRAQQ